MEDEGTAQSLSPSPDDIARMSAATKRIVIQPISSTVTVDTLSDEQLASEHVNGPAIANAPSDTERTSPHTSSPQLTNNSAKPQRVKTLSLVIGLIILACGTTFALVALP